MTSTSDNVQVQADTSCSKLASFLVFSFDSLLVCFYYVFDMQFCLLYAMTIASLIHWEIALLLLYIFKSIAKQFTLYEYSSHSGASTTNKTTYPTKNAYSDDIVWTSAHKNILHLLVRIATTRGDQSEDGQWPTINLCLAFCHSSLHLGRKMPRVDWKHKYVHIRCRPGWKQH